MIEIVEYLGTDSSHKTLVKVKCHCGTIFNCRLSSLKSGNTKSCGCRKLEVSKYVIHGDARRGYETKEHVSYRAMKARCYNPKNDRYNCYGGRGIEVCERWRNSYINFISDMGRKPKGHTIERINVNGNYEPNNCKWISKSEQAKNKRGFKKPGANK